MPYETIVLDNGSIVTTRYTDKLTSEELVRSHVERYGDPETIKKYQLVISDYSQVHEPGIRPDDVIKIAKIDHKASQIQPNIAVILIMHTDLQFALGRVWQAHASKSPWKTHIFRTHEEADKWIEQYKNQDQTQRNS